MVKKMRSGPPAGGGGLLYGPLLSEGDILMPATLFLHPPGELIGTDEMFVSPETPESSARLIRRVSEPRHGARH